MFALVLSGYDLCLDNYGDIAVILYPCHLRENQRWTYDTDTKQIINMNPPNNCWDINGKP